MPKEIVMDEKLFAHILLDPELGGRHAVEGNHFVTTFGYLNQYIDIYFEEQKQVVPEALQKMRRGMKSLLTFEEAIRLTNSAATQDKPEALKRLNKTIVTSINQLKIGGELLVPGGWSNSTTAGHAMIYKFTRTSQGLQFSIYNSGAGIQYHEKTSSTVNERYYPIRIHQIPTGYTPQEITALVNRLMLAQLPSYTREHPTYNEEYLYHDINTSLTYLDAIRVRAREVIPEALTTAGQLSGTCAQRVIHQMLKINFGDLTSYQNFIFQFKRYALREFTDREVGSMSAPMIELVRLAIKSITKLLKQLGMQEISNWLPELTALNKRFSSLAVVETPSLQPMSAHELEKPLTFKPHVPVSENEGVQNVIPARPYEPIQPLNLSEDLFSQLDALLAVSDNLKDKNLGFVIEQLEQAIVSLPLPPSFDPIKLVDFKAWDAYTGTDENIQKMIGYLERLQSLYVKVCGAHYPNIRRPRQQIVHGILVGLGDFFYTLSRPVESNPDHIYRIVLKDTFWACDRSPWMAANDPLFDEKFNQLLALYDSTASMRDKGDSAVYDWYRSIITPEENAALIKIYETCYEEKLSWQFGNYLVSNELRSLYTLFEFLYNNGKPDEAQWKKIKKALLPDEASLTLLEQGILQTFSKQQARERFFITSMNAFDTQKKSYVNPRIFEEGFSDKRICFSHSIKPFRYFPADKYSDDVRNSLESRVLSQGIPGLRLENPNVSSAARELHWDSNTIQLSADLVGYAGGRFFVRDLLHLRTSSAHQIKLTLDYFKQAINTLDDQNTQTYVEANLFERNYLSQLLDTDQKAMVLQLDGFIQRGLQYFLSSQALMTQASIFFIHLRFLFNDYLAQKNPELASTRLKQDFDELTALINRPHDDAILASLHQYRFLTAMKLQALHQDAPNSEAFFPEALQSLFFIQRMFNPSRKNHSDMNVMLERAQYHFQGWLEKIPDEVIRENIKRTMKANGIDITDGTVEGDYPRFYVNNTDKNIRYDIDVAEGRIFKDNRASGMIPPDIKTHAITKRLGLNQEAVCFMSPDQSIIELITDQQQVRITKATVKEQFWTHFNYRIEKTWLLGAEAPQWYQLCPLHVEQNSKLGLGEFSASLIEHDLPGIFNDGSITVWVNPLNNSVILVKNDTPIFQSNALGELEQLDAQGLRNGYVLSSYYGAFEPILAHFEDSQNIIATHKDDLWQINLPRYDLVLETVGSELRLHGTDYTLTDKPSPFPVSVACLNLTNLREQQVIVAVQPFHVAEDGTPLQGGYYPLKHGVAETRDNIWNYDSSVKHIIYKLIDGEPKPDKPADALYLCYLYLANHQHEKAWAVLDGMLGLEGNYQELVYLEWIVNKLPMAQDKSIKNPVYLACQLRALAMFTDNLADDKKPVFPPKKTQSPVQEKVIDFYTALPKTIGTLLTRFQKDERHLSHPYALNNDARRSLLNTWQRLRLEDVNTIAIDNKFHLFGALGYQYRRLSLETLLKEKQHIEAVQHTLQSGGKVLPKKFAKRLDEIDSKLRVALPIMKLETQLEKVVLPQKINLGQMMEVRITTPTTWTWESVDNLTSDLSQEGFFKNINAYLYIALLESKTSAASLKLKNFCIHCVQAGAHPSSSEQEKFFANYAYGFYLLINAPYYLKDMIYRDILFFTKLHGSHSLSEVFKRVSSIQTRPIEIYQARDVFQQVLAGNEEVLEELSRSLPVYKKINVTPIDGCNKHSMAALKDRLNITWPEFYEFTHQYSLAESTYERALQEQLDSLEAPDTPSRSRMQKEQTSEQEAGRIKFDCAQQQKAAAQFFAVDDTRKTLISVANDFQTELEVAKENAWRKALIFAKQTLADADSETLRELEKIAGLRRETLTEHDLLKLYFNADESAYVEMTGLSSDQIQTLHNLVHRAVTQSMEAAHLQRLNNILKHPTPDDASSIATILMSENQSVAQNDPCLMVFQHQENILLRKTQCLALQNLLTKQSDDEFKFNESVEKVIMGGGKSKVILPLIAQKKANGHSLVFVEVPRPLLKTNHADLNQTSHQLFDQKAHCFEFSRNSPCSPERLEEIYNKFRRSMVNKEYWVTTGESIQSLELKYLELLLAGQPLINPEIWQEQVKWMGKITTLIRDFGDVVIDEMHQGLLLKKELNYSLGESECVDSTLRDLSVKLYRFIDLISQKHQPQGTETLLRAEAMRIAWTDSLASLTDELLAHEQSPLRKIIGDLLVKYGPTVGDQLRVYLRDEADLPMMGDLDYATQDILAFYKEQLSALLPHTLSQKHKVNYGPSDEKRCNSIAERVLAVPYIANSQPSERSDFGNLLTKVNYTIQSLLIDGLNDALLKDMITAWFNKAKVELDNNPELLRIENTEMAIGVNQCLEGTGFQLQSLNIKNDQQIAELLEKVQYKTDFIFKMLEQNILEKISIEPDMLHSNALNHVDLYHSVQGLTGTPYNYTTYHERTQFNRNTALGTDGYLLETLKHKKTGTHAIEFTQMDAFLPKLFSSLANPKPRAIIDVGAMFTGISNIEVARALANHWNITDPVIKHILYFNADNELCALNVKNQQIIALKSSNPDEINQKLDSTPEERFTYYDQAHTVGADLKQSPDSTGVVLIDPTTQIQAFLQGAMRMRGLEANQTIEIVTPQAMKNETLENLMDRMVHNEQQQLREDNFNAAIAKMENAVRNDLIEKINALPEEAYAAKEQYAKACRRYFVQSQRGRLYDKYGHVGTVQETTKLLMAHKTRLLKDWEMCISQLHPSLEHPDVSVLNTMMTRIMTSALPYCQATMKSCSQSMDQETETQLQKENQVLIEQNKELQKETYIQNQTPRAYTSWSKLELTCFLEKQSNRVKPLNAHCPADASLLFSPQLVVSNEHAFTYNGQTSMLSAGLKPVHAILFAKVGEEITACLITNQELQDIAPFLDDPAFQDVWVGTTQHTRLAGNPPEGLLDDPGYKTLIEQTRFFHGEFALLNQQKEPFQWTHKDCETKVDFFQKNLERYRPTKACDIALLEAKLSKTLVGFRHLATHRFQPLAIEWEKLFPGAAASDISTLRSLTQAFDEINKNDLDASDLNLDDLLNKYELPVDATGALTTHLGIHKGIKQLMHRLQSKPNFEKLQSLNIFLLLGLLSVISGHDTGGTLRGLERSTTTFFFEQLGELSTAEWTHLINSPNFESIRNTLSPDAFITLCLSSMKTITDSDWKDLIDKLDQPTRVALFKDARVDVNKKGMLMHAACIKPDLGGSFTLASDSLELFCDALPKDQINQAIPVIMNLNIPEIKKKEILVYIVSKTSEQELQKTLLLNPYSLKAFLSELIDNMQKSKNRLTSGQDSIKIKALINLRSAFEKEDAQDKVNKIPPDYLLGIIQSICEQKRHSYNLLWEPQSIVEYKAWLWDFNASEFYIKDNPPMTSHQLAALADKIGQDSVLDDILTWQPPSNSP